MNHSPLALLIVVNLVLGIGFAPSLARADVTNEFDKICGSAVSNLGCSDVAGEYSVVFGAATTAIVFAKEQGALGSSASCKAQLFGGDPKLQYILNIIETVSGNGVNHFVKCACDVAFSNTTCSSEIKKDAEVVVSKIASIGKAIWKGLKSIGCSAGLGGCDSLTEEQKKGIYFACRAFGYREAEIKQLNLFGLNDPSGKAYKDISKSAMCFFIPNASSSAAIDYYENLYQSFLSCGFHKGVAGEDPGNPRNPTFRQCGDGMQCFATAKPDGWVCKPPMAPAPHVVSVPVETLYRWRAKTTAAALGAQCGVDAQDPFQVSCATYERYGQCLKQIGSCHSSNGVHWDEACCRLVGSGAGAPAKVKKAQVVVSLLGPSCAIGGKDPLEIDCGSGGTYAKCRQSLNDCHSSDGWSYDDACCKLKGGMTNPSHEYRVAAHTLRTLHSKDAKLNDQDALEIQCRTVTAFAACTNLLPATCQVSAGHDYWSKACCRLHTGANW